MTKTFRLTLAETSAALTLFMIAFGVNYHAGMYVDRVGARQTPLGEDLFLYLLPHFDVSPFFIWGFAGFLAFAAVAAFGFERKRVPYLLWMYSMLILIRAFFVCLTPMGAPAGYAPIDTSSLGGSVGGYLTFNNDLFFSAHTAMPFLGSLLFRRRWISPRDSPALL